MIATKCGVINITSDTEIKHPCTNCDMNEENINTCLNMCWNEIRNIPFEYM